MVQAIGAAESEVLNFGAPKKIDGDGAINLVNAAVQAQVEQYVMVTSLGTGKWGWPAGNFLYSPTQRPLNAHLRLLMSKVNFS